MKSAAPEPLDLILFGGSSGSLAIFESILKLLVRPASSALIFILHRGKSSKSVLPHLFRRKTSVIMREPHHLDCIEKGNVYFAFHDYHMLIGPDARFYYDLSEKDFFSRPSIDATFLSAAVSGIPVRAAMLFSGSSVDGAFGMKILAEKGFKTYVFDPAQSESQRMPEEALRQYADHRVLFQEDFLEVINDIIYPLTT